MSSAAVPEGIDRPSELAARRNRAIPRGVASATRLFIQRANNAEVWDADG